MHEWGIVKKAFDLVVQEGSKGPVHKLVVKMGKARSVPRETFISLFKQLAKGTEYENLEIEFYEIPLVIECPHCGFKGEIDSVPHLHVIPIDWTCPKCGKKAGIISGTEAEARVE